MPQITYEQFKKSLPWAGAALLLMFVFLLGFSMGLNSGKQALTAAFETGFQEAKTRAEAAGFLPVAAEMNQLHGFIAAVGDGEITVEADQTVRNPLEDPAPPQRRVKLATTTTIKISSPKTLAERGEAATAFEATLKKYERGEISERPEVPSSQNIEDGEVKDLRVGQEISVSSLTDIYRAPEFTASDIIIMMPAVE